jgi:hypothetical protein
MENEKNSQPKRRKKTVRRILQIILGLVVLLILFIVLAVPAIISSNKGRQFILAKINQSINGRANFAALSMGWFKGIKIEDLSFKDHSGEFSVQVKQIATEPHYGSLLAGNLSFGQTTIDQPNIEINLANRPSPQATAAVTAESKPVPKETAGIAIVSNITVNDGNVKVIGTDNKTVELAQINTNVNLRPPGKQSSFDLNMIVAADNKESKVQADGKITPVKAKGKSGWTLEGANGDLAVEVNDLDLESLESFFALAGVDLQTKGDISVNLKGQLVNGQIENVSGLVKGTDLDITGAALKGDHLETKVLDADVNLTRKGQMMNINNLNVKTDWATFQATGSMPTTIKSMDTFLASGSNYELNGTFNCNIASLASQMPNTIGLKGGTTISSGIINGTVKTATQAGKKQIRAEAELTNLKGLVEGKEISLSQPIRAAAQISPEKGGINIENADLTASFAKINCSGNLESLKYNAQTNLTQLQSELGQFINLGQYQFAGAFTSQGAVSINEKQIAAKGSAGIENLRVSSKEKGSVSEPKANVDFALDLDRQKDLLSISSVQATTGFGQFSVKGAVVPLKKDSAASMNATILATDVNLSKLKPFAVMFGSLPKDTLLAGIAESEVKISSETNTYHIITDKTNIKNIEFGYPGKKPFVQPNTSVTADISLNPTDYTYSGKLTLLAGQIKMILNLSKQNKENQKSELKGTAELDYDWQALSAIAGQFLPEDLTLTGKQSDKISFTSEYPQGQTDKILSNLNASGAVGFQSADYMGLDFSPTNVKIVVQNGLLKIAPFTTTVNNGQINFAADVDFKQSSPEFVIPQPISIKDVQINDQTTRKLLKYLNPIFANAINVNGIANLNCERLSIPLSAAAKNKAEIIGTVSVNQLRMQTSDFLGQLITLFGGNTTGTTITIHPTRFVLSDGFLKYDDMQMDVGNNPANFSGTIGLDKSLEMSVTLPYTTEGRTIRIGSTSTNRITLPITGTVDHPKLDTKKLLENQLQQQLLKGLNDLLK